MKKKKITLLVILSSFSIFSVAMCAISNMQYTSTFAFGENGWYHYAAVAPTEDQHGSREFWANSYNGCKSFVLEEPDGPILGNRDFSQNAYFNSLEYGDERYVPSKFETRNAVFPILNNDNTVTYGIYPQSVIHDESLVSALDTLTTKGINGWYLYNGEYYTYSYAYLYHSSSRVFNNGEEIVKSKKYWFKCEPIVWEILSSSSETYQLHSKFVLDHHQFQESFSGGDRPSNYNNYEYSQIRSWINNEFLNSAFCLGNSNIQITKVRNGASTTDSGINPYSSNDTEDKVYLLSYGEYSSISVEKRKCETTEWERATGGQCSLPNNHGEYWTRSPKSDYSFRSYAIEIDGTFCEYTDCGVSAIGVRPVINITFNPIKHKLSVSSSDASKGNVSLVSGHGFENEIIIVKATPSNSCVFNGWYVGDTKVSDDLEYKFEMPSSDYSLVGRFKTNEEYESWNRSHGSVPSLKDDQETIKYGLYPQTNVNDAALIENLNLYAAKDGSGWYLYNDEYYDKVTAKPYSGSQIKFDNGEIIESSKEYWFKCEPIEWGALSNDNNNNFFVVTRQILDSCDYNHTYHSSSIERNCYWASDLHDWLNGTFYNQAFYLNSSKIQYTEVDNNAYTTNSNPNSYSWGTRQELVCLPSYLDYTSANNGFSSSTNSSITRKCSTTDYARAKGVNCSTDSLSPFSGSYWTRSADGGSELMASYITMKGGIDVQNVLVNSIGVRPAITISINDTPIDELLYRAKVISEDTSKGGVDVISESNSSGEIVTVQATPAENCIFEGWYCGSSKVSDESVYSFTMPSNHQYLITGRFMTNDEYNSMQLKLGAIPEKLGNGYFKYGLYPQTVVNDSALIKELNKLSTAEANGWYLYQGDYYAKAESKYPTSNAKFHNGSYISSHRDYWFKCERITWRILCNDSTNYYVCSQMLLDVETYGDDWECSFEYSNIRSWLNNDFYNHAFSFGDSNIIATTITNGTIEESDYFAESTDKIFLPSSIDYTTVSFGFATTMDASLSRRCETTDYARARGARCDVSTASHYGRYWTRTAYDSWSGCVCCVMPDGSLKGGYQYDTDGDLDGDQVGYYANDYTCVRPAMHIVF